MSDALSDGITVFTAAGGMRSEITTPPRGGEPGVRTVADVPVASGGGNEAPSPTQLLLGALGACKAMTARAYATRKGWPLGDVRVSVRYVTTGGRPALESEIELHGDLTDEQRERVMAVIESCHVQKVIEAAPAVVSRLVAHA